MAPLLPDVRDGLSRCRQLGSNGARLHCQHDWQYRLSRFCIWRSAGFVHWTICHCTWLLSRGRIACWEGRLLARRWAGQHMACGCLWNRDIASIWRNGGLAVFRTSRRTAHPTALYGIIALTALAMGTCNGTVRRLAVPELTTTVLTLTVAALAFDFSLTPGNNPRWRRRVGLVFMMLSGPFVGVQLLKHSLALLLGASAALTALCALAQIYREEQSTRLNWALRNADGLLTASLIPSSSMPCRRHSRSSFDFGGRHTHDSLID